MSEIIEKESEAWNSAKGFSAYFVLFPLIEARRLIKLCLFGYEEPGHELNIPESVINQNKILAINRLLQELIQMTQDIEFVMDKNTRPVVELLIKRLNNVEDVIDGISMEIIDQRTGQREIKLNQDHYNACLTELRKVFSEIKRPMNTKNLIFPSSDEIDLDKIKSEIIEGG